MSHYNMYMEELAWGRTKFKCPKCKRIFFRDGRSKGVKGKKSIKSYCDETDQYTRCRRVA